MYTKNISPKIMFTKLPKFKPNVSANLITMVTKTVNNIFFKSLELI